MGAVKREKTFINTLAYSRILKYLMIFILSIIIIIDVLVIALVINLIEYAPPEKRSGIILRVILLMVATVAGLPLFYFVRRNLRDQWIKINDEGLKYNSWTTKISTPWNEVTGVSIVSRGRYGQALRTKALRIDTRYGSIYALPIFVDKSMPIPELKFGMLSRKLSYPNGRTKEISVQDSDIYKELKNYIPNLLDKLEK
jgi:hypothetical protein